MPREVFLIELWRRYADQAEEIRVKRIDREGVVKLKARLRHYLYTIRLPPDWAEKLIEEYRARGKNIVEY